MGVEPQRDWTTVKWKELVPRLLLATTRLLDSNLLFHNRKYIAEDLVQEACMKAISGIRSWDESRCTLYQFLFGIVKSDLSNLTRKGVNESNYLNEKYNSFIEECKTKCASPEQYISCFDAKSKFLSELENNDKYASKIAAIMFNDGITKPKELSMLTCLDEREINNIKRRIKRGFAKFLYANVSDRSEGNDQIPR